MNKRIWIILAAILLAIAACIGVYFATRPSEPVPPPEPVPPVTEPQPGQDEPEPVVVYVPDEQGETLTPVGAQAKDDSDQALVDALIEMGALPAGVEVQSSSEADGVLTLDMNAVYGNAVRSSGTAGETMLVYALVNTFVQARGVDKVQVNVDGNPLESGHEVYDSPLEMGYTS